MRTEQQDTSGPLAVPVPAGQRRWVPPAVQRRLVSPPRWWQEFLFVAVCYSIYTLIRDELPNDRLDALSRAQDIFNLERAIHINPELAINRFLAHIHWLVIPANYYYATTHFVVTICVLCWLYFRHPLRYRAMRTVLFLTTGLALIGFWLYPLAPPRMLTGDGFVDTVVKFHTWGGWGSSAVAKASNQFAAMPSLHLAWALWCGVTIALVARHRWVKVAGALYPAVTLFVILGTANHFVADAAAGVATFGLALAGQRLLYGRVVVLPSRRNPVMVGSTTSGASSTGK